MCKAAIRNYSAWVKYLKQKVMDLLYLKLKEYVEGKPATYHKQQTHISPHYWYYNWSLLSPSQPISISGKCDTFVFLSRDVEHGVEIA